MHNDLAQRYADEFERHVDSLVAAHKGGKILAPNPFFDRPFSISDVPRLKYLVRNALRAQAWFAKHGPTCAAVAAERPRANQIFYGRRQRITESCGHVFAFTAGARL